MGDSWGVHSNLWWNLCFVIANAVLVGRRGFIFYAEDGLSSAKKFSLRSSSLPYVTVWCIFAVATVVFAFLADEIGDAVNSIGVLGGEFVAICVWRHYFGNGPLIQQIVGETHERLKFLLIQGLGMNETECEQYCSANEAAVVELWKTHLRKKRWTDFTAAERDDLIFDTGIECGKVLEDQLWEGVHYDVAAFFQEWRTEVEELRSTVRVPNKIARSMISGNDSGNQALLCVAVLVANEDAELRASRKGWDRRRAGRQFSAARIAKRKAAAEGILRWPDCVSRGNRVRICTTSIDPDGLCVVRNQRETPCVDVTLIPSSVLYTLSEIIRSGYLRIQPGGTIQADVTFKYGNMVFNKDQWNPLETIQRAPFRYITSATWMAGDVAFVVEQREITGSLASEDGSGYLNGVLRLTMAVEEIKEATSWVERSQPPKNEQSVWGDIKSVLKPKPMSCINRPAMWLIDLAWWLMKRCEKLFRRVRQSKLGALVSTESPITKTARCLKRTAAELLVMSESRRDEANATHRSETRTLQRQFGSISLRSRFYVQQQDSPEDAESAV